jgi:hypothetical protein
MSVKTIFLVKKRKKNTKIEVNITPKCVLKFT